MTTDLADLYDQLCLRWAREADLVVQETGQLQPTLVLMPRDVALDEVAIRLDGLRGNLAERADAIVAELAPVVREHPAPAGLVLLTPVGTDAAAVYVTLGSDPFRRALGFRVVPGLPPRLERADEDPPVEHFAWLDRLLTSPS